MPVNLTFGKAPKCLWATVVMERVDQDEEGDKLDEDLRAVFIDESPDHVIYTLARWCEQTLAEQDDHTCPFDSDSHPKSVIEWFFSKDTYGELYYWFSYPRWVSWPNVAEGSDFALGARGVMKLSALL